MHYFHSPIVPIVMSFSSAGANGATTEPLVATIPPTTGVATTAEPTTGVPTTGSVTTGVATTGVVDTATRTVPTAFYVSISVVVSVISVVTAGVVLLTITNYVRPSFLSALWKPANSQYQRMNRSNRIPH